MSRAARAANRLMCLSGSPMTSCTGDPPRRECGVWVRLALRSPLAWTAEAGSRPGGGVFPQWEIVFRAVCPSVIEGVKQSVSG